MPARPTPCSRSRGVEGSDENVADGVGDGEAEEEHCLPTPNSTEHEQRSAEEQDCLQVERGVHQGSKRRSGGHPQSADSAVGIAICGDNRRGGDRLKEEETRALP